MLFSVSQRIDSAKLDSRLDSNKSRLTASACRRAGANASTISAVTRLLRMMMTVDGHNLRAAHRDVGVQSRLVSEAVMRAAAHGGAGKICELETDQQHNSNNDSDTVHHISIDPHSRNCNSF